MRVSRLKLFLDTSKGRVPRFTIRNKDQETLLVMTPEDFRYLLDQGENLWSGFEKWRIGRING